MQPLDRTDDVHEDGLEGRDRAPGSSSRPTLESLFGQLRECEDVRGGQLDQWVRRLRDGDSVLSSNHHEMTHEGILAEEPLPDNQQGPGKPNAEEAGKDYLQIYSAGYVVVQTCRQRQELFYPGGPGFPIDSSRLRDERLTGCRCSAGVLARVGDTMMTIEDNWRAVGPRKLVAGMSWWSGFTVFVVEGTPLPWETPSHVEDGGDEESMDHDPELSDVSDYGLVSPTTATKSTFRSRSRSPMRAS